MKHRMKRRWIVLCGKTKAKIFEYRAGGLALHELFELGNPDGALREQALVSDRPGRAARTKHTQRSPMNQEHSHQERVQERFMAEVASQLAALKAQDRFDTLVVMAEPRTLGRLRPALAEHRELPIEAEIHHDLLNAPERSILEHAHRALTPPASQAL
jgi:protein required for attachment to host cells